MVTLHVTCTMYHVVWGGECTAVDRGQGTGVTCDKMAAILGTCSTEIT